VRRGKQAVYGRMSFQNLAKLRRMWPDSLRTRLGAEAFFPGVDWAGTQAFSEELRGNIWINLRGRDPQGKVEPGAAYEALRDRIVAELPELRDPETGAQPVRRVWRREELYQGPFLEQLPDLVVEAEYPDMFRPHGDYRGSAARQLSVAELAAKPITGCHRQDGIIIAWGPDVQGGAAMAEAALIDVAPTVLHLLGHPVPVEMDGRVLVEVLRPEVAAAVQMTSLGELGVPAAGVAAGYTDAEAERVRERLAGLGYLG
jgi:predicted AlkP superfamily phosphohydrolase/phosphomutase